MYLEPIMQSEVTQTEEKQIIYINTYMWNLENGYWWIYLQSSNGDADIDNGHVDTMGKGEGGTNWDSSIETYTLKQIASRNLLYDTGSSHLVLSDNLEGWDGLVGGRKYTYGWPVYLWLIHADAWQKPTQYCKAMILQLKIKFLKFGK